MAVLFQGKWSSNLENKRNPERERDKAWRKIALWLQNPTGRKWGRKKNLLEQLWWRPNFIFVTGLCGQLGGSVRSQNGFKSTVSQRQPAACEGDDGGVGSRFYSWDGLFKALIYAFEDRPSVNQYAVRVIVLIRPSRYWVSMSLTFSTPTLWSRPSLPPVFNS